MYRSIYKNIFVKKPKRPAGGGGEERMCCQPRFLHFLVEVYQLFRQDLCVLQAGGRGTESARQREGGAGMGE